MPVQSLPSCTWLSNLTKLIGIKKIRNSVPHFPVLSHGLKPHSWLVAAVWRGLSASVVAAVLFFLSMGSGQHVPMLPKACSLYPALDSKGFLGLVNRPTLPMLARVLLEEESLYNEHTNTCPCVFLCMCVDMCMYVYMYARVFSYVRMFMCIYVLVSVCMCTSVCICNMFVYVCTHVCTHACACLCVCICIYMWVHVYLYMYVSVYMCTHACLCVSAHVHVCTCVYVCVHISHYSFYSIQRTLTK